MRSLRVLLLAAIALAATACSSGIVIPTIPSFAIPSFAIPSFPIDIPTVPPGGNTSGACALVTEAEMGAILGVAMTVSSSDTTECTWTSPTILPSVVIRYESGESIATGKLITSNGRDLNLGGFPAYYGEFASSLLWIEKGGRTLVVQAIWSETGDAAVQKISQMGTTAIARF